MTTALVVGLGAVGTRAARQLIDTPGIDRLLLADRDDVQLAEVADAFGRRRAGGRLRARRSDPRRTSTWWSPRCRPASTIRSSPPRSPRAFPSRRAKRSTTRSTSCGRSTRTRAARGSRSAIGCGLAPGLVDALARHAASMFETVDEIRVAAHRLGRARERRDGAPRAPRAGAHVARRHVARGPSARRQPRVVPGADRRARLPHGDRRDRAARRRVPRRRRASACSSASRRSAPGCAAGSATRASGARPASRCGAGATERSTARSTASSSAPRSRPARCSRSSRRSSAGALGPALDQPGRPRSRRAGRPGAVPGRARAARGAGRGVRGRRRRLNGSHGCTTVAGLAARAG